MEAGILAPSADNRHLFRFEVLHDGLLVVADHQYRVANAQTKLLAWISFGAVFENMRIAASVLGFSLHARWFPARDVICETRLAPLDGIPDPLADAIPRRHTNRRFFKGPALQPAEQRRLEHEVAGNAAVRLVWLDAVDVRRPALRLIRLAESERFRSRPLHTELFAPLHFEIGYKRSCDEGIPIGAAEVESPVRPLFRLMSHWPVMRMLNFLGGYWFIGWRAAYFPARLSPHLGLLATNGDLRSGAIQIGRGFERLWLRATAMGLALQPFAAAALYALPEFEAVSSETRDELRRGWSAIAPGGTPLMVFRLGHAPAPTVTAGRPPLSHFLRRS